MIIPVRDTYLRFAFYEPEMGYVREGAAALFVNLPGRHSIIPHLLAYGTVDKLSIVRIVDRPNVLERGYVLCAGIYHRKWFLFPIH